MVWGYLYYKQSTEVEFFSHSCLGLCGLKMTPGLWRVLQGLGALGRVLSLREHSVKGPSQIGSLQSHSRAALKNPAAGVVGWGSHTSPLCFSVGHVCEDGGAGANGRAAGPDCS